jgi:ABC-2 type transport system ATP-binding protein
MIEVTDLTRCFGSLRAVDGLSFTVAPGEVLGFLGPNGAGKTTTMKVITGYLASTSGSVRVLGHDIVAAPVAAKREIGYLPEGAPLYGDMTARGLLGFVARARGLDVARARSRIDYVVEHLALGSVLERPLEQLSKGFRRRVGLAQAILHDPRVLIMDEPTDGLDPNQKFEVRALIRTLARDRVIVISTHILEEVDAVCTRALIIAAGRLRADATPQELAARSRYAGAVTVRLAAPLAPGDVDALRATPGVAGIETDARDATRLTFVAAGAAGILDAVRNGLAARGAGVEAIFHEAGRLDDVFRALTTTEGAAA